jgi:hypothetical protein
MNITFNKKGCVTPNLVNISDMISGNVVAVFNSSVLTNELFIF